MEDDDLPPLQEEAQPAPQSLPPMETDDDDPMAMMASMGVTPEKDVNIKERPWMKYHNFILIENEEQLVQLIDACLASGRASLDLETQGLDNRIYWHDPATLTGKYECFWDPANPPVRVPQTVHKIVGYCISPNGRDGYYIPIRHTAEMAKNVDLDVVSREIRRLCLAAQPEIDPAALADDPLGSPVIKTPGKVKLYFWHAKFDQEFLYPVTGIDWWHPESFEDGMLMYFTKLSSDKSLGLKDKSKRNLQVMDERGKPVIENGSTVPYEMVELKECFAPGRKISFPELDPHECRWYWGGDSICTFLHCTKPEMQEILTSPKYNQTYRLEKQVTQVTRIMERNRIRIDIDYVRNLLAEAEKESAIYRAEIVALASQHGFRDFDPQSPKQLSEFLFASPNGLNMEPKPQMNEKSGQYKTDADTLEKLVEENSNINPILVTIVKFRQVEKVVGTYLKSMANNCDQYGDLRYQFRQVGAATGRFSAPAGDPDHGYGGVPIHGIPSGYDEKKPKVATALRRAFIARPGYVILKVDFAGEELRIVTNLSKEPIWEKEFLEGSGDLHSITARAFFNKQDVTKQERQAGKMANFSLVYGGGQQAIMRATGCNPTEAARRKSNFDKSLPTFAKWVATQKKRVHMEKGVWTAFGRWIPIPEIDNPEKAIQAGGERAAINYPIQGSGADIMKIAMVKLHKTFYQRGWYQNDIVRMMLTVHDEIVFEVKLEHIMEVAPVVDEWMTFPGRIPRGDKAWKVPLVAEPLIDKSWDAKYDLHKILHGEHKPEKPGDKPLKSSEMRVGDRVYQRVPDFLEPYLVPDWKKDGHTPPPAAPPPPSSSDGGAPPPPATPVPSTPAPAAQAKAYVAPAAPRTTTSNRPVFEAWIANLSTQSVSQVWQAVHHAYNQESGKLVRLKHITTGEILIDPDQIPLTVDEGMFNARLRELNL